MARGPSGHVVAWRPDGQVLASYDAPGELRLLDAGSGRIVARLRPRALDTPAPIGAVADAVVAWAPAGDHLALLDARQGTLNVWTLSAE